MRVGTFNLCYRDEIFRLARRELSLVTVCSPFHNHQVHLQCWEHARVPYVDALLAALACPLDRVCQLLALLRCRPSCSRGYPMEPPWKYGRTARRPVPLEITVPTLGQSWGDRDRLSRSLDWEYEFAVKIKFVRRNTSRRYFALQHQGPVNVRTFRSKMV
jgi:hypothetical protein